MFMTVLLLGGVALLAGSILEGSDDQYDEAEGETDVGDLDYIESDKDPIYAGNGSNIFESLEEETSTDFQFANDISVENDLSPLPAFGEISSEFLDSENFNDVDLELSEDNISDDDGSRYFNFEEELIEIAPDPLSDWTPDSTVVKIKLEDNERVTVDIASEEGTLHILQADYIERIGSEIEGELDIIHTGANIYFVPAGEEFPTDYVWSETGASLYNTNNPESDPEDFGNIKFVSRVDTGLTYGDALDQETFDFQDNNFLSLQSRFASNIEFSFSAL